MYSCLIRQAINKTNMLHNAYRKGRVKWDDYRKQRNLTTFKDKKSKLTYFGQRCDGGPNNQFWRTIKPLMPHKSTSHDKNIIAQEDGKLISDAQETCEILTLILQPWQTILASTIVSHLTLILRMAFQILYISTIDTQVSLKLEKTYLKILSLIFKVYGHGNFANYQRF